MTYQCKQVDIGDKCVECLRSTSFGDMIISLSVEIPKNLSDNQKRLLKEFNQEYQREPNNDENKSNGDDKFVKLSYP